jgi:hypothetical protein
LQHESSEHRRNRLFDYLLTFWPSIVSWQWSGSRPGGEVAEVKEQGELAIQSNKGNTIKKNAEPGDPAIHIERSGNDVRKFPKTV